MISTPIVVAGATASGKSELAIWLAQQMKGEILSVDAVQNWRGFEIGAGKVSTEDRKKVPHHLIDSLDPNVRGNVAQFYDHAASICRDIDARHHQAIFCGGSTMYISALLGGLADQPSADSELRQQLEKYTAQELWERLKLIAPDRAAALHPNDRLRIVRALETAQTIEPLHHSRPQVRSLVLVICWPRNELYNRIERRVEQMLSAGLIEEVRALRSRYGSELPGFEALGYAEVCQVLEGKLSEGDLKSKIVQSTRRYAKRQMTFWRNEPVKRGYVLEPRKDGLLKYPTVEIGGESGGSAARRSEVRHGVAALQLRREELVEEVARKVAVINSDAETKTEIWYLDARTLITIGEP